MPPFPDIIPRIIGLELQCSLLSVHYAEQRRRLLISTTSLIHTQQEQGTLSGEAMRILHFTPMVVNLFFAGYGEASSIFLDLGVSEKRWVVQYIGAFSSEPPSEKLSLSPLQTSLAFYLHKEVERAVLFTRTVCAFEGWLLCAALL